MNIKLTIILLIVFSIIILLLTSASFTLITINNHQFIFTRTSPCINPNINDSSKPDPCKIYKHLKTYYINSYYTYLNIFILITLTTLIFQFPFLIGILLYINQSQSKFCRFQYKKLKIILFLSCAFIFLSASVTFGYLFMFYIELDIYTNFISMYLSGGGLVFSLFNILLLFRYLKLKRIEIQYEQGLQQEKGVVQIEMVQNNSGIKSNRDYISFNPNKTNESGQKEQNLEFELKSNIIVNKPNILIMDENIQLQNGLLNKENKNNMNKEQELLLIQEQRQRQKSNGQQLSNSDSNKRIKQVFMDVMNSRIIKHYQMEQNNGQQGYNTNNNNNEHYNRIDENIIEQKKQWKQLAEEALQLSKNRQLKRKQLQLQEIQNQKKKIKKNSIEIANISQSIQKKTYDQSIIKIQPIQINNPSPKQIINIPNKTPKKHKKLQDLPPLNTLSYLQIQKQPINYNTLMRKSKQINKQFNEIQKIQNASRISKYK